MNKVYRNTHESLEELEIAWKHINFHSPKFPLCNGMETRKRSSIS